MPTTILPDPARPFPAPFDGYRDTVRRAWIDHNDHLNVGYYMVVFDLATDAFNDAAGLDLASKFGLGFTTMVVEAHANYLREVRLDAPLRFTTQLLGYDAKRVHFFHRMYHAEEGFLAATNEIMLVTVNLAERRVGAMPPALLSRIERVWDTHRALPRPEQAGRIMRVPAPLGI